MGSYRYTLSNNKCTTEGANYLPNTPLFQIGGNAMNKNEFNYLKRMIRLLRFSVLRYVTSSARL